MKKADFLDLLDAMDIGAAKLEEIAVNTGFKIRKGTIEPIDILYVVCCESIHGTVSFNDLAAKIDAETDICVSRQACKKGRKRIMCGIFKKDTGVAYYKQNRRRRCRRVEASGEIQTYLSSGQHYYQVTGTVI